MGRKALRHAASQCNERNPRGRRGGSYPLAVEDTVLVAVAGAHGDGEFGGAGEKRSPGGLSFAKASTDPLVYEVVGSHGGLSAFSPYRMYRTPSSPRKSESCVQRTALCTRAVARIMLSAIGNFNSREILEALRDNSKSSDVIRPLDMTAIILSASYKTVLKRMRLKTS